MPYCENCGKPVNSNVNFCGNCGTQQKAQTQITQPMPPPPYCEPAPKLSLIQTSPMQTMPEQISSFIIVEGSKRFGSPEYFTGVLTNQRLIFVPLTKELQKEVTNISKQQAKGKVPPGPIIYPYQQLYLTIAPSLIIANTQGCLVLQNSSIVEIKLKVVGVVGDGYSDFDEFEMKIISDSSIQTFHMGKRDEYVARLRQIYQDKVKLPPNLSTKF